MIEPRIRFTVADLREALRVPDEVPDSVIVDAIETMVEDAAETGLACHEVARIASRIFRRAVSERDVVELTHGTAWSFGRAYFWAVQKELVLKYELYAKDALEIVVAAGPGYALNAARWADYLRECRVSLERFDAVSCLIEGVLSSGLDAVRARAALDAFEVGVPKAHSEIELFKTLAGAVIALRAPKRETVSLSSIDGGFA